MDQDNKRMGEMKGYKGFNKDLKCRGFQYEVGKTYEMDENPNCCDKGFHFCKNLFSVHDYYDIKNSRVCEIEAIGDTHEEGEKISTNKIRIVRELSTDELSLLTDGFKFNTGNRNTGHHNTGYNNTGNHNTGYHNTGSSNTGNHNTGNHNTGSRNTGCCNTGYRNTGHRNTGCCNTGNRNTGSCNTGDHNTGSYNTGDGNTGHFNTGNWDEFRLFDKKASRQEWEDANKPGFIFDVDPTETNGDMKAAWKVAFDGASEEDIQLLLSLPKFSKKVFKKITGIDLKGVKKK